MAGMGMAGFMEGFLRGYKTVDDARARDEQLRLQRDQAETAKKTADLQQQAAQLSIDEHKRSVDNRNQIKAAMADVAPTEVKDGDTVVGYELNGQQYAGKAQATHAAELYNSDLVKLRRGATMATQLGDYPAAQQLGKQYEEVDKRAREDTWNKLSTAYREGGLDGVAKIYNDEFHDGHKWDVQTNPQTGEVVQRTVGPNGKITGTAKFKDGLEAMAALHDQVFGGSNMEYLKYRASNDKADKQLGIMQDTQRATESHYKAMEGLQRQELGIRAAAANRAASAAEKDAYQLVGSRDYIDQATGKVYQLGTVFNKRTGKYETAGEIPDGVKVIPASAYGRSQGDPLLGGGNSTGITPEHLKELAASLGAGKPQPAAPAPAAPAAQPAPGIAAPRPSIWTRPITDNPVGPWEEATPEVMTDEQLAEYKARQARSASRGGFAPAGVTGVRRGLGRQTFGE